MPFAVVIEYDNQCYSACLLGVGDSQYDCDMLKFKYCLARFRDIETTLEQLESGYFFSVHEVSKETADQVSDFLWAHNDELDKDSEVVLACSELELDNVQERKDMLKLICGAKN